jgi:hypothetical protein
MIDDQTGIGHFGRIPGSRADAVRGLLKYPVAAVFAASHDKIPDIDALIVLTSPENDASAGV